ncbi:MAG: hypothetical protein GY839_19390 [candidate division Zixibacteria bacterium]|nr:hypothetical protein [candidate division Zixibacteria bacterium]
MSNQKQKDLNETIELSLAPKNLDVKQNVRFEAKHVRIKDLENTFKTHNYSPIIWSDGYRSSDKFKYATGFVVDIDKGLTIEDAEVKLQQLQLNYFIIPSKRHTPENHRFHILLFFNYPVYSVNTYKEVSDHIASSLFPETDDSTLDAARFLFGSPDHVKVSSFYEGADFDVLELGELWDDTLVSTDSKDQEIRVSEIVDKTSIYCPFHNDNSHSAFIEYSKKSDNWFIRCTACARTFWKYKRLQSLNEKCEPYWSYGTEVYELGIVNDEFYIEKIGRPKFHILTRTDDSQGEKARAFKHLVDNKHISHISRIDYLGDIDAVQSYHTVKLNDGIIEVHHAPIPTNIKDNNFIENYLDDRFGQHKQFIKEYMAVLSYTNYQKLPTLIFKGPRGNGKSTFAEILGEIYHPLTYEWHGHEETFTYEVEKKLLIVEENESTKMSQYKTLKKYTGQKYATVNKKFKDPYKVKNNMNIILLTNESIPLYVSREEMPSDEYNNQFFVFEFPPIQKAMDPKIQEKILNRLGHYIRTELKSVYDTIQNAGYRYSIQVPITNEEKALFRDNVTDVEADSDLLIQRIIEKRSSPIDWNEYAIFIDSGYLPIAILREFRDTRNNYNRIIKNLKKRKFITGEQQRKQFGKKRQYCYEMTDKLIKVINDGRDENLTSTAKSGQDSAQKDLF